jgi:membrane associated rhomboid family serine protease
MNWIDRLERKYRRFSIPGLVRYLVIATAILFALNEFSRSNRVFGLLELDISRVLGGEIWRLVSFIFVPPVLGIIAVIFMLYIFYIFGTAMEMYWGSFRLTLYYFIGMVFAIIAAFITGYGTSEFIILSIFLAFAYINPDFKLLLFFIIPVKIKYLAWFEILYVIYSILFSPFYVKIAALLSFASFLMFFGRDMYSKWVEPRVKVLIKQQKRKKFKVIVPERKFKLVHKCRVCGRTSEDHPQLKFGYCQACGSDYEYCSDHLKDHKH